MLDTFLCFNSIFPSSHQESSIFWKAFIDNWLHVAFLFFTMKTHTHTHYLYNVYPDDPRCSMFAYICLHLPARPTQIYANIPYNLSMWDIFLSVVFISLAHHPAPMLWTNLKVMPKLWTPCATELRGFLLPRAKEAKRVLALVSCGGWAMMIRPGPEDEQFFEGNFYREQQKQQPLKGGILRFRKSLKTPGEFWKKWIFEIERC